MKSSSKKKCERLKNVVNGINVKTLTLMKRKMFPFLIAFVRSLIPGSMNAERVATDDGIQAVKIFKEQHFLTHLSLRPRSDIIKPISSPFDNYIVAYLVAFDFD